MEGKALVDATNSVELDPALQPWEILEAADAPLLEAGQIPSGIAADPRFLKPFRTARTSEGVPRYPNVGFAAVSELAAKSEDHTSELKSRAHHVCRLLLEKKQNKQ